MIEIKTEPNESDELNSDDENKNKVDNNSMECFTESRRDTIDQVHNQRSNTSSQETKPDQELDTNTQGNTSEQNSGFNIENNTIQSLQSDQPSSSNSQSEFYFVYF